MANEWHEKMGGRKFLIAILGMGMGFALALLAKLSAEFSNVIMVSTASFMAGNTITTREAIRHPATPPAPTEPPVDPTHEG
jgi:hypothetical protein